MKTLFLTLVTLLLVTTSVQSQNKIEVQGITIEALEYQFFEITSDKLNEYVKIELWSEENYNKYNETLDKKYKHKFRQEGFCTKNNGVYVKTRAKEGNYIFKVTRKVNGKFKSVMTKIHTKK